MKKHFMIVNNLTKQYGRESNRVMAVDHVSFCVEKGEFIGIMGASGSGKTTLLHMLSAIDTMSDGQVLYSREEADSGYWDLSQMNEEELADFRQKNLGFVFQDYNLLNTLTVEENIMLPAVLRANSMKRKKEKADGKVKHLSGILQITDILTRFPYEISGGQKQRAACARALVNDPKLILADEPTGALDSRSSEMLLHTFQVMNEELGATILMVTHDVFSASYCNRILFLQDGKIGSELKRGDRNRRQYVAQIFDALTEHGEEYYHVE